MKTKAAVLRGPHQPWEITELDLQPPRAGEVLVRFVASGLCHSDEHLQEEIFPCRFPIVGGHEGAGVIEEVGEGVVGLRPGDHIICSYLPVCGHCRFCASGQSNLCDLGATILDGSMPDGSFRLSAGGEEFGAFCMLGTFSEYSTVSQYSCIKVEKDVPLETVCLLGCGVPVGWCSAVYAGGVGPGDTVVIYGAGGVGMNAVQGAAHVGATNIVVVDPADRKRKLAEEFGATHAVARAEEAHTLVQQLTRGVGADEALVIAGVVTEDVISSAFNVIRKGGTVAVTGAGPLSEKTIHVSGCELALYHKRIVGALFGGGNPFHDIPHTLDLYRSGQLKLDELITRRYPLDEINEGYADMLEHKNIRGVVVHGTT